MGWDGKPRAYLEVSTTKDTFIQDEGLRNETWFSEFDIRVPAIAPD